RHRRYDMGWLCADPPAPPNPTVTAAAQTGTNVSTAVANAMLNRVNQVTPQGNLTYSNTGTYNWTDPSTGQTFGIPQQTVTQTLSPTQQAIQNAGQQTQTNFANLASNLSGSLQNTLGAPFDPNRGAFDAAKYLQQNPDVYAAALAANRPAIAAVAGTPGTPGTPASTTFDPQLYLQAYPDVAAAAAQMGMDPTQAAYQHYQLYGQAEGRTGGFAAGTPGTEGTPGTPGQEAVNVDPLAYAAQHYREHGMLEGRAPGGEAAPARGDPNTLKGFDAATTYGDPNDRQLRTFDDGDGMALRQRAEEALFQRMDPQLQRDRKQLEARLADQGIKIGSPAYQDAMDQFSRQLTDTRLGITEKGLGEAKAAFEQAQGRATFYNAAQQQDYTQAALRAQFGNAGQAQNMSNAAARLAAQDKSRAQWLNEQYTQRQAPINEITALMSGSQVQQPNFVNVANANIPTTDYAGLVNNRFSQDMANYQQSSQNFNQIMGGIFGAVAGLTKSDRREKNVGEKLGTVFAAGPDGEKLLPVYEYSYKDDPSSTQHIGPMAQDVEKVDKKAVVQDRKGTRYIDMTRMGSILQARKAVRHA
ncbi:MAG TPA: tail fiber domain-containing protein, partial [Xanthobacteraceae bacterium]|nr:tail fiber domain-containing protein [Xanthobacteraceae bacterium]